LYSYYSNIFSFLTNLSVDIINNMEAYACPDPMYEEDEPKVPAPEIPLWQVLVGEFIGTFALVFFGASAAALTTAQGGSILGTGIAFWLVLMTMIYVFGSYTGAHFNPAVSFGLALTGRMNWGIMLAYWIVQFLAGIAAAAMILYFFGSESGVGATVGTLTNTLPWTALLAEAIATFFLVITVLIVTRNPTLSIIAGVAIGAALGMGVIALNHITGGSLNPARSLGPAIFSGNISTIWIYIIGPLLGGLIAAIVYRVFVHDFNCCYKVDDCGNKVLDDCGKPIKECKRPLIDNCGRLIKTCP
jgi:MIP family channel proteins